MQRFGNFASGIAAIVGASATAFVANWPRLRLHLTAARLELLARHIQAGHRGEFRPRGWSRSK